MNKLDVTVLGAGPYGLACGAHLRAIAGLDVAVFGDPMEFWRRNMPEGMLLRSPKAASNISAPGGALTVEEFDRERREEHPPNAPIALDRFVDYGLWFQRRALPSIDPRRIERVERSGDGFWLTPQGEEPFFSKRVVVAAGIGPFARRPAPYAALPRRLVSHCCDHRDVRRFAGKRVVVVGAGQAALESAALISEAGGEVEVLVRQEVVQWHGRGGAARQVAHLSLLKPLLYSSTGVGPVCVSRIVGFPGALKFFPRRAQDEFLRICLKPSAAWCLVERLKNVRITTGRRAVEAREEGDGLRLRLCDGSARRVDHVVLGTGYQVDVSRYRFLAPELLARVDQTGGYPRLGRGLESTAPGLHFAGAAATWSFGPLMHFVVGTEFAARHLAASLARRRN